LADEGIVPDTMGAVRERCYDAYQAQKIFIMAQKYMLPDGWDPLDPLNSVKKQKGSGKFVSLQKVKNPVPANVLTATFLRYAYGISKETFRRWMGEGRDYGSRIPHNKGGNVITDRKLAATYFSPKCLFMKHEMGQFKEPPAGKHATLHERKVQRTYLKEQFKVLPSDIMEVYKRATREKMAMHGFVEEAIVNTTLNDSCEQSFRHLSKVSQTELSISGDVLKHLFHTCKACFRVVFL
jgi:hypothetical protein